MIAEPLNDKECLTQMTAVAADGVRNDDVRALAARFTTTAALAKWIRTLPQRDDSGNPDDGPRVACDVTQRARLAPADPNCVERAILYLAAAELVDARPVRQLATIDVSETLRHTFPLEDGEPVVLDPSVRRNALRAGVWRLRNATAAPAPTDAPVGLDIAALDPAGLLEWLTDLAEEAALDTAGATGRERVVRARWAMASLLGGRPVTPRDRGDILYTLRLAGEIADWFGEVGTEGYRVARALLARLAARGTLGPYVGPGARRAVQRNLDLERVGYWAGKVVATYYGLGGAYDAAYAEVARRPASQARAPPQARSVIVSARPASSHRSTSPPDSQPRVAPPALALGALEELEPKKGA